MNGAGARGTVPSMKPENRRSKPAIPTDSILPTRLMIHPDSFVASTAVLRGEVTLGARSSIWYNAIVRGDLAPVVIGEDTNIQDGAILHVETDGPALLGNRVTVGHNAIVHACHVADDCLIGISATILSGAKIGRYSIVGAGSLVVEGAEIPERSLVLGIPGRVVREVKEAEIDRVQRNWAVYVSYARKHREEEEARAATERSSN